MGVLLPTHGCHQAYFLLAETIAVNSRTVVTELLTVDVRDSSAIISQCLAAE